MYSLGFSIVYNSNVVLCSSTYWGERAQILTILVQNFWCCNLKATQISIGMRVVQAAAKFIDNPYHNSSFIYAPQDITTNEELNALSTFVTTLVHKITSSTYD